MFETNNKAKKVLSMDGWEVEWQMGQWISNWMDLGGYYEVTWGVMEPDVILHTSFPVKLES